MSNQHPITPPPDLVEEWFNNSPIDRGLTLATQAAQWGADQELEACCEWLYNNDFRDLAKELNNHRRPKPPSLKEQALAALNVIEDKMLGPTTEEKLIRKALEALPND